MNIRAAVRNYMLQRGIDRQFKPAGYTGFHQLKQVGILFRADTMETACLDYARSLEQRGKKVELLGYIPQREKEINTPTPEYPWFCRSHLNWWGQPVHEAVSDFKARPYGVYIELIDEPGHPADFITSRVAADFKIGFTARDPLEFNLLIQKTENDPAASALKEIDYYLNFINQPQKAI